MAATQLGEFPPAPKKLTIMAPGGASLTGMAQLPRGMSEDCTVAFNLMLQLGPIFASLECLIRLFKFIGGFVDVVKAAPDPFEIGKKMVDLVPAAEDLAECIVAFSPLGICPPIKSALKLIREFLGCLVELLKSIVQQKLEIGVQMARAEGDANDELMEVLRLADANADRMKEQGFKSMEPALDLLQSISGLVQIAGGGVIEIPSIDQLTGGELGEVIQVLEDFLTVLDTVIGILPC